MGDVLLGEVRVCGKAALNALVRPLSPYVRVCVVPHSLPSSRSQMFRSPVNIPNAFGDTGHNC